MPDPKVTSVLSLYTQPDALQLALVEATVSLSGYFYAVDFGPGIQPQHHRVGKNAVCSCYLAESCPAVDAVRRYLEAGGERSPDPPLGFYPVRPAHCPICGDETVYEARLSSPRRGAGWRCLKGGTGHYWQRMVAILAEKLAANPWLFPPVVMREGKHCFAWDGIQDSDQVLQPGIRRSEVITPS